MRITFLINLDLYSNYALNLLLPTLSKQHAINVFFSSHVGSAPQSPALRQLAFFEQMLPNQVLFPIIDRSEQQGELLTFAGLSKYLVAPMEALNDPNSAIGLNQLQLTRPELVISIRYGRILQAAAIAIPTLGVMNLHSGKLPEYRGVMATFRAMLNNDSEIFSTLHWINDPSIDTGPVISHQGIPRDPTRCYLGNVLSLYDVGCPAVLQAAETLNQKLALNSIAASGSGTYYSFPTESEITRFCDAGHQWVETESFGALLSRFSAI